MRHEHEAQPLCPETLQAFGNDAFRARIFHEKYALRGADGTVLEQLPAQMWQRVSQGIAAVEAPEHQREWEDKFGWLLSDFRMVPGGRILHAIGNPNKVTALNCYVVPAPTIRSRGFTTRPGNSRRLLSAAVAAVSTCRRCVRRVPRSTTPPGSPLVRSLSWTSTP